MNKEDIVKLDYKAKAIGLITAVIVLIGTIIGKVVNIGILFWIGLGTLLTIVIVGLTIYLIEKYFLPVGVFAVSAIIVNEKMELLLIKDERDGIFKQPGCHYRTNKLKLKNEIEIPFSKIKNNIEEETGINKNYFDLIDLSKYNYNTNRTLADILASEKVYMKKKDKYKGYENNEIMPPPFIIMQENSIPKTSGAKFHIDMFYAFRVNGAEQMKSLKDNVKFYSIKDINGLISRNETIYPDLMFVFDNFKRIHETTNFPKSNIRLCTFNTSENKTTLLWRITHDCNANCEYCLLGSSRKDSTGRTTIKDETINGIIERIIENKIEKIIISGGEPLLIENLVDIVKKIDSKTACKSITICTNGINLKDDECYNKILKLKNVNKFSKFVISMDHFVDDNYRELKSYNADFRLSDLINVINKLKEDDFVVFINVVATQFFLANPKKYIDFWRDNDINRLSISYPIKRNSKFKFELKYKYDEIISGKYGDISFLENDGLELIIPICKYNYCPHSDNKIFHVDSNGSFSIGCIEKKPNNF